MGAFFNNLHLRKTESFTSAEVCEYIKSKYAAKGFTQAETPETADCTVTIYEPESSGWMSVYSDMFSFSTADDMRAVCTEYSDALKTDALALLCFDSDFLFMNLVNTSDGTDAWMKIGDTYGMVKIGRRANRRAWGPKVSDYKAFSKAVTSKYICAEEALGPIGKLLSLDPEQATVDSNYVDELIPEDKAIKLFFSAPEEENKEFPFFRFRMGSSDFFDYDNDIWMFTVVNKGGASKGIGFALKMLSGDSIEKDTITFSDTLICYYSRNKKRRIPISMEKVQAPTGEWIYRWIDRSFRIPAKVSDSIPEESMRHYNEESSREITFIFKPHGDRRRFLDICAIIAPLENPKEGADVYYPWHWYKSKRDYIEFEIKHRIENNREGFGRWTIPDPDDYDLDD